MKIWKRLAAAALAAAMVMTALPMTAFAATSISSIKLDIDSNISSGDSDSDVEVSTHSDSAHYEVSDVEVTNEPSGEWKDSSRPKLKVTITADDDYKFSSISKSDVTLYGSDGTVTSVKKSDDDLIVNITLDRLEDSDDDDDDDDDDDEHHHEHEHEHHHHHHHHDEGEAEEYGIGTYVYYARRPFHIGLFDEFVARKWPKGIIRAKGICWFKDEPEICYVFEQAGRQVSLRNAGQWYATMPQDELAQVMEQQPSLRRDWDEQYGDRMQKLVFIGQHLDKEQIARELDFCLV